MVEFFVSKGIIGLGHMDLFAGFFDACHGIGVAGRYLHIIGIIEVPVTPVGRVQAVADPVDPNGLFRHSASHILRGKNDGCGPVTGGADVQPVDRIGHHLRIQDVFHGDLCT